MAGILRCNPSRDGRPFTPDTIKLEQATQQGNALLLQVSYRLLQAATF